MIDIKDKSQCSGCSACTSICPHNALSLQADQEGFDYPRLDKESCIECGLCLKVCPQPHEKQTLQTYAAVNKDEGTRLNSSSGGIFSAFAEDAIKSGWIVYGAAFDKDRMVEHAFIDNIDDIESLRGSKYVQSKIEGIFPQIKQQLKEEKKILFCGTPCQVAGLRSYLGKEYTNLTTIDFACNGVVSPEVWRRYHSERGGGDVKFRLKAESWKKYKIQIGEYISYAAEDPYMKAMIEGVTLRPSCYDCRFRGGYSGSDITMGDWWKIQKIRPDLDDDKGISFVEVHTEKGMNLMSSEMIQKFQMGNYDGEGNKGYSRTNHKDKRREKFFSELNGTSDLTSLLEKMVAPSLLKNIKKLFSRIIKSAQKKG